jgi:release factor glutamine methyltransferase
VIGRKEFYSLGFKVTPDVLIPRPETELLVDRALSWCEEHPQDRTDLLDVGTGSGCIAVTIAKRLPSVHVIASDVSEAALAVAAENAERHGVSDRVRCLRADLLDLPADAMPEAGFDLILANPPYIAEHERDTLPRNVREHEPAVALFSGPDGLAAFRRIAADVRRHLRPGGTLILEVGHSQAAEVEKLVVEAAGLAPLGRHRDLGGIERAVQFTLSA